MCECVCVFSGVFGIGCDYKLQECGVFEFVHVYSLLLCVCVFFLSVCFSPFSDCVCPLYLTL